MNGLDIYEGNDIEDWNALKSQGVEVVIVKATQGVDYNDKLFAYRYPRVKAAGIKFGVYHFAGGLHSAGDEAQHFLDVIAGKDIDTVLFLDIENYNLKNWGKQEAINFCNTWFNYVKSKGYKVGLYTGEYFYHNFLEGNIPADVVLWLANYSRRPSVACSWQYTSTGRLNGAVGNLDLDIFQDDIYVGTAPQPVPQPISQPTPSKPASNTKVQVLQHQLNQMICAGLAEDGVRGPLTDAAIRKFQGIMGLVQDTVVGPKTQAAINQIMSRPLDGIKQPHLEYATRLIQYRVGAVVDGVYGKLTATAVSNWQRRNGLVPDGVVGPKTWNKLLN